MVNQPLNISSIQSQLHALAQREGVSKWDLGASRSSSASVQVDRGEAKQLRLLSEVQSRFVSGTSEVLSGSRAPPIFPIQVWKKR